jgi:D-glycero-D-manno-heptose 1,7-bisphosphate phosphatase
MTRAAFLDRDGVINRKAPEGQYITRWAEFEFLPRVAEAIALLKQARFSVIVVSNQRCVAEGLITVPELDVIHQRMFGELAAAGAIIDGVYYCPHEKQSSCSCRKPAPGLLLRAAREHHIDLTRSWMIGDSDSDIQAGKNAGCKTAQLLEWDEVGKGDADVFAHSLFDIAEQIQSQ